MERCSQIPIRKDKEMDYIKMSNEALMEHIHQNFHTGKYNRLALREVDRYDEEDPAFLELERRRLGISIRDWYEEDSPDNFISCA
jgi:hypothetical protein